MKKLRALPIPFLILILAGVVSLFSVFAGPGTPPSEAQVRALPALTVGQEHATTAYFRVLSWLLNVTAPRGTQPDSTVNPLKAAQRMAKTTHAVLCPSRIELCTLRLTQNIASRTHRQALN